MVATTLYQVMVIDPTGEKIISQNVSSDDIHWVTEILWNLDY